MVKKIITRDMPVNLKIVPLGQILPLRARVLRRGRAFESANFSGDTDKSTVHAAAFCADELVGCLTLMDSAEQSLANLCPPEKMRRLRGMAVDERFQGLGIGSALIKYAEFLALGRGASIIWMDARTSAVEFYQKAGYEKIGKEFVVQTAGLHFKMYKKLAPHVCSGCK